jgi:uncharacterized RDD family membrane protein YckC
MTDSGWESQGYGQPRPQPGYQQPGAYQQPGYQQPGYQQPGAYQQPGYQAPGAIQPYQQPGGYPGQGAQPGLYLDPATGLTIPQGTEVAPIGRRVGAYFLAALFGLLCGTLIFGIAYLIWGLIAWGSGQTPVQQCLGLRCWNPQTQTTATWGTMFLRWLSFIIYAVPFVGIIAFFVWLNSPDRRTFHDKMAGIVVLSDPNKVLAPQKA